MILCQSWKVTYTRRKVKGQNGYRRHGHGKEGTTLEPLSLWTSSVYELFFIELRSCAAKVWHIGQSWAEATVLYKLTQGKIDPQQHLSSTVVPSTEHLEIYKDKLVDARSLSHHWNKMQSWAHWDDWINGMMVRQTDRRTNGFPALYSRREDREEKRKKDIYIVEEEEKIVEEDVT